MAGNGGSLHWGSRGSGYGKRVIDLLTCTTEFQRGCADSEIVTRNGKMWRLKTWWGLWRMGYGPTNL